jgi:phosphatidate cytidylyltransferase
VRWLGVAVAAALPVGLLYLPRQVPLTFATLAVMALLAACFIYYLLAGPLEHATTKAALTFFGVVYAGLGIGALAALRGLPSGLEWVLLSILLTFGNDTGAYFAGRFLGKHKLYVAVSPNKTWEGFFGGMAFAVLLVFGARATFMPQLQAFDAIGLGIPCSLLGPAGDLCESMLKRAYGVKDSGKIIPGHGGLLDRVDALLFNGPYVLFYALIRFGG